MHARTNQKPGILQTTKRVALDKLNAGALRGELPDSLQIATPRIGA
jgi:hypothetical protein